MSDVNKLAAQLVEARAEIDRLNTLIYAWARAHSGGFPYYTEDEAGNQALRRDVDRRRTTRAALMAEAQRIDMAVPR